MGNLIIIHPHSMDVYLYATVNGSDLYINGEKLPDLYFERDKSYGFIGESVTFTENANTWIEVDDDTPNELTYTYGESTGDIYVECYSPHGYVVYLTLLTVFLACFYIGMRFI